MVASTGAAIPARRLGGSFQIRRYRMIEQAGRRPELIIALVCPSGARVELLEKTICDELKNFGYVCEKIHVSDLLKNFESGIPEPDTSEYSRITIRQRQAFVFRTKGGPD